MPDVQRRRAAVIGGTLTAALAAALFAAPAYAVVDPATAVPCAAEAAAGLAALVDPAAPQAPTEIPAAGCLHP
ncbi:hypothetical protein ABT158_35900 [Nonomuraea sp. NPDC001636]|uniref:hypothetical protein n=1 Tax=Nonomuraea sp. NPDC001636 TaxID=3154391 RepID=UPI003316C9B3